MYSYTQMALILAEFHKQIPIIYMFEMLVLAS